MTISKLAAIGVMISCCMGSAVADEPQKYPGDMFPPEFRTIYGGDAGAMESHAETLHQMGAKPLWHKNANQKHTEIIRVLIQQSVGQTFAVTLNRKSDGTATVMRKKRAYGPNVQQPAYVSTRAFKVAEPDVKALDALIEQATLWKHYPGGWQHDDGSICTGGIFMVAERASAAGHGLVQGNILCEVGAKGVAVVDKLLALGRISYVDGVYRSKN